MVSIAADGFVERPSLGAREEGFRHKKGFLLHPSDKRNSMRMGWLCPASDPHNPADLQPPGAAPLFLSSFPSQNENGCPKT